MKTALLLRMVTRLIILVLLQKKYRGGKVFTTHASADALCGNSAIILVPNAATLLISAID